MATDIGRLLGRGIAFPPRVGADGRIAWSEGEVNVREAIRIILMTDEGERLQRRQFGGGLASLLFEPTPQRRDNRSRPASRARWPNGSRASSSKGWSSRPTRMTARRRLPPSPTAWWRPVRLSG